MRLSRINYVIVVAAVALGGCSDEPAAVLPPAQYDGDGYCALLPTDCQTVWNQIQELKNYSKSRDMTANANCHMAGLELEQWYLSPDKGFIYSMDDNNRTNRLEIDPGLYVYTFIEVSPYNLNIGGGDARGALAHEGFHGLGMGWDSQDPVPGTEHYTVQQMGYECGLW